VPPFRKSLPTKLGAIAASASLALTFSPATGPSSASGAAACTTWRASTVVSGLGTLENLSFDGRGSMLVSAGSFTGSGRILRLSDSGRKKRTLVAGVGGPGGHVVVGRRLYFTSGNGFADGVTSELGMRDGKLNVVDLRTKKVRVVARDLAMPNGLVRLPDGSFLTSRDIGFPGRTTRIHPDGRQTIFAPSVTSTNGMAVDVERRLVYIVSTFNPTSTISVVDLDDHRAAPRVITLDGIGPVNSADEIVLGRDGNLYVTLNVAGQVVRVDPDTGRACTIATGLPFASSLRFGAGPGWDARALYVTSFAGTITRLRP